MPRAVPDYHRYLPLSPEMRRRGVGITGAGIATVPAGACHDAASALNARILMLEFSIVRGSA